MGVSDFDPGRTDHPIPKEETGTNGRAECGRPEAAGAAKVYDSPAMGGYVPTAGGVLS
jgi:hypothetical protein